VRRAAIALLALSILLPLAAAQAGTEYTIQIHNQSSQTVDIIVFQKPLRYDSAGRIRERVAPGDYFVRDGIKANSCVVVRVAHDGGADDARCKDNRTPVNLRCDVSDRYSCKVHAGEVKDLVVNVVHPR
jgi:hypothetical protein